MHFARVIRLGSLPRTASEYALRRLHRSKRQAIDGRCEESLSDQPICRARGVAVVFLLDERSKTSDSDSFNAPD